MSWVACSQASSPVMVVSFVMSGSRGLSGRGRPGNPAAKDRRRRLAVKRACAPAHINRNGARIQTSTGVEIGELGSDRLRKRHIVSRAECRKIGAVAIEEGGGGALDLPGHGEIAKGHLAH